MTLSNLKPAILSMLLLVTLTPFHAMAQTAGQAALSNQDVIELVKAGLSSEVVIAKIKSSACNFDTSPAALKDLKTANVPDNVILALVQASSANSVRSETPSVSTPVSGSPLPTADQIVDKFVQAVGRESFQKRTSTHAKLTIEASGKTAELEVFEKAPNKRLGITTIPKQGEVKDGFDGFEAWSSNKLGIREKTPQESAMAKWLEEFLWAPWNSTANAKVKGDEIVGNRPTYIVEFDLKESGLVRMYFDKETGLILRRDIEANQPQGRQTQSWYYEDFRDVNGRKIAYVRRRPSDLTTMKLISVEDNVPIDDGIFARPTSGKVIPTNTVRSVAYRVVPQQNTTYIQSGTNSSNTSCYGSGTFQTWGNFGSMDMNTNCNTTYTTPSQIPITWKFADVYITVEDAINVYLIGCRANWRWSNCEPLIVGDVFPAELSGNTMTISAMKNGKKAIQTKYNILRVSQK